MSSRVRHANSQDNPKSDRSSPRINPQARRILLNLAPTWTGSPILKPVLQSAFDILDIVEVECSLRCRPHHCADRDICRIGPKNFKCAMGLLASLY